MIIEFVGICTLISLKKWNQIKYSEYIHMYLSYSALTNECCLTYLLFLFLEVNVAVATSGHFVVEEAILTQCLDDCYKVIFEI